MENVAFVEGEGGNVASVSGAETERLLLFSGLLKKLNNNSTVFLSNIKYSLLNCISNILST
jgi:hypothetical protein